MNVAMMTPGHASSKPLDGKVSLVTGSTSGIGLGIARALAAAGSSIVLNGFGKTEEIAAAQDAIKSDFPVRTLYSSADMSKPKAIEEMIAKTLDTYGRLDILVNNAGVQHVAPLADFPVERWDQILAINLSSAFHTTRAALPSMRKNGFGRIINVASAHGLVASSFKADYVAAKHGIVGLTKATALETAEEGDYLQRNLSGLRLHAACRGSDRRPGQIARHPSRKGIRDILLAQQPNKRFATVEEMGAVIVFLASEGAASITGIALPVAGGWTAH